MSAREEGATRALTWDQPTTAAAAVPTPANNGSANAEGVEIPAHEVGEQEFMLLIDLTKKVLLRPHTVRRAAFLALQL